MYCSTYRFKCPRWSSLAHQHVLIGRGGTESPCPRLRRLLSRQLFEQHLGVLQVSRIEAFGEPAIHRGQQLIGCLALALLLSLVSERVNTFFVERHNGSDRHRNSRKVRKTYRFSKDWEVHAAVTYFTMLSANFCCPVRTLRVKVGRKRYQQRTPAMAAGLTDHIWPIKEWLYRPSAVQ